jgi:hypothetical protein
MGTLEISPLRISAELCLPLLDHLETFCISETGMAFPCIYSRYVQRGLLMRDV